MARIRTIKPDFWTDEKVVEMSPLSRLLFIGLWNFADDEGRMVYSPTRIKLQILPADSVCISELLGEIRGRGLITVYAIDGVEYLQINKFTDHQKVDKRTPSKLPPPPPVSAEVLRIVPTEGNGMEGKGMEEKPIVGQTPPDDAPGAVKDDKRKQLIAEAEDVLDYLNRNAGKGFKFRNPDGSLTASADRIIQRLKQGYTALQLREVVHAKVRQWGNDEKMVEYLRPATLFAKENFEQYHGELEAVNG